MGLIIRSMAELSIELKDGSKIEYVRESPGEDYEVAYISLDASAFGQINSLSDTVTLIENHKLIHPSFDYIFDTDEFVEQLIAKYGEEFEPKRDEGEWYEYRDNIGAPGDLTYELWEDYNYNKKHIKLFLEKLEKVTDEDVREISLIKSETDHVFYSKVIEQYSKTFNSEGMCDEDSEIIILNGVEQIEDYAFDGCTSLKRVIIPENVTKIGVRAFSVNIPVLVSMLSGD